MTGQDPDIGRDFTPAAGLLERWGMEMLFSGLYLVGSVGVIIFGIRQNKPLLPFFSSVVMLVAGLFSFNKNFMVSSVSLGMGLLLLGVGGVMWARRRRAAEPEV